MSRFAGSPSQASSQGQLFRDLARAMNPTRNSSGLPRHSQGTGSQAPSISDFDPENEAMMSTRQLGNSPLHLPQLRASAQKYRQPRNEESEYAINTSAIDRAFPDFSQGETSFDNDSISIEIGRGPRKDSSGTVRKYSRAREYSSNVSLDLDGDSLDFAASMTGSHLGFGSPLVRQRPLSANPKEAPQAPVRADTQLRRESGLRKEIVDKLSPPEKTKDYGSGGSSRKGSSEGRTTLAALHARVRDEDDVSRFSNDRPPTVDLTGRNTRFCNPNTQQALSLEPELPTKLSSTRELLNTLKASTKPRPQTTSTVNHGTQQSFVLPDLPNLSELVSGVFEDGTPVFSRHGKSRASKSTRGLKHEKIAGKGHNDVDEAQLPDDEQEIFLTLKLLQDKVALLETSQAEGQNTIQELQHKNRILEANNAERRRVSHRSDSAVGLTDSDGGEDARSRQRKAVIEKNRLEASVRTLQIQMDSSNRKVATSETIIHNITKERDSAVAQLGVAYISIEQLKEDNENLKLENDELKARLSQLAIQPDSEVQRLTVNEAPRQKKGEGGIEAGKATVEDDVFQPFSQNNPATPSMRAPTFAKPARDMSLNSTIKDAGPSRNRSTRRGKRTELARDNNLGAQVTDEQDSDGSLNEAMKIKGKDSMKIQEVSTDRLGKDGGDETSQDMTFLSFLHNEEIAQLRKTLEQERAERKERQAARGQPEEEDAVTQNIYSEAHSQRTKKSLPRKSSSKELTSRSAIQTNESQLEVGDNTRADTNRRHSETSILGTRSRRRGLNADNMTSAFILPDITLRTRASDAQILPTITKENQKVLDGLAKHNSRNCTLCKRDPSHHEHHDHKESAKETITIERPVPVSERMPETAPYEDEATMRPSQPPGLALATVLKGLEDEIAHLKIKLARYQALYNGHDPSLSKRKRKAVYQKIEGLLQAIDVRSDQIYALYDVLEGQKQDGLEISEEQVEHTLQSIGIDAADLNLKDGGKSEITGDVKTQAERHPWDLSSDDENNDLQWEGIESTVDTTNSGVRRANKRKGIHA